MLKNIAVALQILTIALLVNAINNTPSCAAPTANAQTRVVAEPEHVNLVSVVPQEPERFQLLNLKKGESTTLEVSGYTSEVDQTDSDPCIGSHKINICKRKAAGESLCASNAFPIGTRVHVEGLGTCTIADHMKSRYQRNVDWYFGQDNEGSKTKWKRAMKIGRRDRKVTLVATK